jgi:hypothetical protein
MEDSLFIKSQMVSSSQGQATEEDFNGILMGFQWDFIVKLSLFLRFIITFKIYLYFNEVLFEINPNLQTKLCIYTSVPLTGSYLPASFEVIPQVAIGVLLMTLTSMVTDKLLRPTQTYKPNYAFTPLYPSRGHTYQLPLKSYL